MFQTMEAAGGPCPRLEESAPDGSILQRRDCRGQLDGMDDQKEWDSVLSTEHGRIFNVTRTVLFSMQKAKKVVLLFLLFQARWVRQDRSTSLLLSQA